MLDPFELLYLAKYFQNFSYFISKVSKNWWLSHYNCIVLFSQGKFSRSPVQSSSVQWSLVESGSVCWTPTGLCEREISIGIMEGAEVSRSQWKASGSKQKTRK